MILFGIIIYTQNIVLVAHAIIIEIWEYILYTVSTLSTYHGSGNSSHRSRIYLMRDIHMGMVL